MYSYHVSVGPMTNIVRNRDRAAMIRKLRALALRPAIAQNALPARALEKYTRLVAYTQHSYAVKHAIAQRHVKSLVTAMSTHPSTASPSLSEWQRRMPDLYRRMVHRVAATHMRPGRLLPLPHRLGEWSRSVLFGSPWNRSRGDR